MIIHQGQINITIVRQWDLKQTNNIQETDCEIKNYVVVISLWVRAEWGGGELFKIESEVHDDLNDVCLPPAAGSETICVCHHYQKHARNSHRNKHVSVYLFTALQC